MYIIQNHFIYLAICPDVYSVPYRSFLLFPSIGAAATATHRTIISFPVGMPSYLIAKSLRGWSLGILRREWRKIFPMSAIIHPCDIISHLTSTCWFSFSSPFFPEYSVRLLSSPPHRDGSSRLASGHRTQLSFQQARLSLPS